MQSLVSTEPTLLSRQKVYQIGSCLYRFLSKEDGGRVDKFLFRPLSGQRRKADLRLATQKIYSQVKEVPALYGQVGAECSHSAIQMSLFG